MYVTFSLRLIWVWFWHDVIHGEYESASWNIKHPQRRKYHHHRHHWSWLRWQRVIQDGNRGGFYLGRWFDDQKLSKTRVSFSKVRVRLNRWLWHTHFCCRLSKIHGKNYGKPIAGSESEKRSQEYQKNVIDEVASLCYQISLHGYKYA